MRALSDAELVDALFAEGLSRKTVVVYTNALRQYRVELERRGSSLELCSATAVRELAEGLPCTRSSRALLRSSLGAYWRAIGRDDAPLRAVRVPSHPPMRCRALEDHEAAVLAIAARRRRDRPGLAVLLGLYCGLRRAEIATLRWRDVGADGWLTVVGKGDRTRCIPVHRVVLEALDESWRGRVAPASPAPSAFVFEGRLGGPANPTTIWSWVKLVARDAGLGHVPTHVLRHTALATALDATRDLRAVQSFAGHSRPETTAGYTRVRRERLVACASAIEYAR